MHKILYFLMDFTLPDFDPQKLSVQELKRILNEYDIDLPTKQQLKSFYVQLFLDNLQSMTKTKLKREKIFANTPVKNKLLKDQDSRSTKSQRSSKAVQAPTVKTYKHQDSPTMPAFTPQGIVHYESMDEVDVNFGKATEFQIPSPSGEKATSPLKRNLKSPLKKVPSDRMMPKTREFEMHKVLAERNRKRNLRRMWIKIFCAFMAVFLTFSAHYLATDNARLHYCDGQEVKMIYPFSPECVNCPPNAICEQRLVKGCVAEHKLKNNIWSFLLPEKMIPFPFNQPKCVYQQTENITESVKAKQIDYLVDVVELLVRQFIGNVECHTAKYRKEMKWIFSSRLPLKAIGMPVSLAKDELQTLVAKQLDSAQFDEYWTSVLDRIFTGKTSTLSTVIDELEQKHRFLISSKPPISSYSCVIRNALWSIAVKYSSYLLGAGSAMILMLYIVMQRAQRQYERHIEVTLVEEIIQSIHAEAINFHHDSVKHAYPGIPVAQLKDHFLPRSLSHSKESDVDANGRIIFYVADHTRKKIWNRIRAEVLKNSSVRETNAQIKGEAQLVWMWIGSSVLTPLKKRRSEVKNSPSIGTPNESPSLK